MIRAIFFDLDGTLVDVGSAWVRCVEAFLAEHAAAITDDRRAAVLGRVRELSSRPPIDRDVIAAILAGALPELERPVASIAADLAARLPGHIEPDRGVIAVLRELAGRYTTAIVSNGSGRMQRAKLKRSLLMQEVGHVFVSGELGIRKPRAGIFRLALAWARVEPASVLMVGDHPIEDIRGAQAAGMQTCFVGPRYDHGLPQPTMRIDRVHDLPGVLG